MAGPGESLDIIQVGLKRDLAAGTDDIAGILPGDIQTFFGRLPELILGSLNKKDRIDIADDGRLTSSHLK